MTTAERRVLEALLSAGEAGHAPSVTLLASITGRSRTAVHLQLVRMLHKAWVQQDSFLHYTVTDAGRAALDGNQL